jgi:DNA-directed RNA polymerase subunit M/transcription elongation factor TFIIS
MDFCKVCNMMLYMRLAGEVSPDGTVDGETDEDPQLSYYCRKCGHEEKAGVSGTSCAYRVTFKQNDAATLQPLNAHTKHDPTLPTANAVCPTVGCSVPGSVRYIRYDDTNIKYIYLCTKCDSTWTVANSAT